MTKVLFFFALFDDFFFKSEWTIFNGPDACGYINYVSNKSNWYYFHSCYGITSSIFAIHSVNFHRQAIWPGQDDEKISLRSLLTLSECFFLHFLSLKNFTCGMGLGLHVSSSLSLRWTPNLQQSLKLIEFGCVSVKCVSILIE